MTITQFGRVEFDPMRVPTSAPTKTKDFPSFKEELRAEVSQGDRFKVVPPNEVDEKMIGADNDQSQPSELKATSTAKDQQPEGDVEPVQTSVATATAGKLPNEAKKPIQGTTNQGGASTRRTSAGKGVEAPSIFLDETTNHKQLNHRLDSSSEGEIISQLTITGSSVPGQGSNAKATIGSDGLAVKEIGAKQRGQVNSPFAGYKTVNKYSLQYAEAARESVFKQIAFRLKADGGEMILRLDPPELGKLNLQMQIENHNQMRLVIHAERPELVTLLEKHMAELEQELQRQGITLLGTEVRHFDQDGASGSNNKFGANSEGDFGDATNEDSASSDHRDMIRPGSGFITADSLDFWA